MKITVQKTTVTEEEIEVTFPTYKKWMASDDKIGQVIKIINDGECLCTWDREITTNSLSHKYLTDESYIDATKEEFDAQFEKTMNTLINLK